LSIADHVNIKMCATQDWLQVEQKFCLLKHALSEPSRSPAHARLAQDCLRLFKTLTFVAYKNDAPAVHSMICMLHAFNSINLF